MEDSGFLFPTFKSQSEWILMKVREGGVEYDSQESNLGN
jgi:hypothetical protein